MIVFEILAGIVLAAFILNGFKCGAIETLGRVTGAVVGFIAARVATGYTVGVVSLFLPTDWAFVLSFMFIFLTVDYLVGILFKIGGNILNIFTRLPILKQISGILGGAFGLLEGIVVIGGVNWLLKQSAMEAGTQMITDLNVVKFINAAFEAIFLRFL